MALGLLLALMLAAALARAANTGTPLEPLNPEIAAHPYRLAPGVREYEHRLSVSPAWGSFGDDPMFALRVAYNPVPWLGYEASVAHTPGHAVHALLHTVNAIVRRPFPGRFQPYATAGYGMMIVYPGQAVNALPVTKNALAAGGGLEVYIRSDLALRGDVRHATVFGEQRDRAGIVAYPYTQATIGLAFYRTVRP
jgi:hypothetical protein